MLNKLCKEKLDKIDGLYELLDQSPTANFQYDPLSELMKKNLNTIREDRYGLHIFYKDLILDKTKLYQLKKILGVEHDLKQIIIDYINDAHIIPEIDQKISQVEQLLELKHDISIYPEKNQLDEIQVLAELVSTNAKYKNAAILCTYGCDKELEFAKKRVLTRCLLVLVSNIV